MSNRLNPDPKKLYELEQKKKAMAIAVGLLVVVLFIVWAIFFRTFIFSRNEGEPSEGAVRLQNALSGLKSVFKDETKEKPEEKLEDSNANLNLSPEQVATLKEKAEEKIEEQEMDLAPVKLIPYLNLKHSFVFYYPEGHTAYEKVDQEKQALVPATSSSDYVAIAERESMLLCCEAFVLDFTVLEKTELTAREWIDENYEKYTEESEIKSIEDITFADQEAVQLIGGGNIGSVHKLIAVPREDYLLVISQNSDSRFLNDILISFKFL